MFNAFILSCVFVIAGNLLILVLFAVRKAIHKKGFFPVMNMAFTDLMLGAFALPSYLFLVGGEFFQLWTAKYDLLTLLIFYRILDNSLCSARIYLQSLYPVRDSMPYIGHLITDHNPTEHAASLFLDFGHSPSLCPQY